MISATRKDALRFGALRAGGEDVRETDRLGVQNLETVEGSELRSRRRCLD